VKIGIGGGIGPVRGGISSKGVGGGLGPLSIGGSWGGGGIGPFILTLIAVAAVLFWPAALILLISGQSDSESVSTGVKVLMWLAEIVYALVVAWWWFFNFAHPRTVWESLTGTKEPPPALGSAEVHKDAAAHLQTHLDLWRGVAADLPDDQASYVSLPGTTLRKVRIEEADVELGDVLDTGRLRVRRGSIEFEGESREVNLAVDRVEDLYVEGDAVVVQMPGRTTAEAFGGSALHLVLIEAAILWAYGGDDRAAAEEMLEEQIAVWMSNTATS
jgi:hypothetical protein